MCGAGAVIHSHGIESCLVTMLDPLAKEFRVSSCTWMLQIMIHFDLYIWYETGNRM